MGSTNKYPHGLNSWVEADKPVMEDFNQDNNLIANDAMWKEDYDSDGSVLSGGGIKAFINTAMLALEGFTTYTHSKSGTTHSLTGTTGKTNIKFIATANFTSGDTFNINGTAYTPRMINWGAPTNTFFATNSVVIAFINGSNLVFPYVTYNDPMLKGGGAFTGNVSAYETNRSTKGLYNAQVFDAADNTVSTSWIKFKRQ